MDKMPQVMIDATRFSKAACISAEQFQRLCQAMPKIDASVIQQMTKCTQAFRSIAPALSRIISPAELKLMESFSKTLAQLPVFSADFQNVTQAIMSAIPTIDWGGVSVPQLDKVIPLISEVSGLADQRRQLELVPVASPVPTAFPKNAKESREAESNEKILEALEKINRWLEDASAKRRQPIPEPKQLLPEPSRAKLRWPSNGRTAAVIVVCGRRSRKVPLERAERVVLHCLISRIRRDGRRGGLNTPGGLVRKEELVEAMKRFCVMSNDGADAYLRKTLSELRGKLMEAAKSLGVSLDRYSVIEHRTSRKKLSKDSSYRLLLHPA